METTIYPTLALPLQRGGVGPKERARFFDISLASIAETASAIDVMAAFRLISPGAGDDFKSNLRIAYAMIVRLKRSSI